MIIIFNIEILTVSKIDVVRELSHIWFREI